MDGEEMGMRMDGSGMGVGKDRRDCQMAMRMDGNLQLTGVWREGVFRMAQRCGIREVSKNQWV